MEEQLRINFPDYTAEEQESDAKKYLNRKIHKPLLLVMKVDGEWAHLDLNLKHKFYGQDNLFQMYNKIKESHPNHNIKYVINPNLESYLREQKKKELCYKQLHIWER